MVQSVREIMEFVLEFSIPDLEGTTYLEPWTAVYGAVGVCFMGCIVYAMFLKTVGGSGMDKLFKIIFRTQATQSLLNAFLLLGSLTTSAVAPTDVQLRVFLCRSVTSLGVSFNVSFLFSLLIIACIRILYIVFPMYVRNLPKVVLQVSILFGWMVIICSFFTVLYETEVWEIAGVYYCLGLKPGVNQQSFIVTTIFLLNCLTVAAYVFIIIQQFTRKVPRRRFHCQNLATLGVCIAQFVIQGISIVPFIYFSISTHRQNEVHYFRLTMLYYELAESVISPLVLMLTKAFRLIFPCCS